MDDLHQPRGAAGELRRRDGRDPEWRSAWTWPGAGCVHRQAQPRQRRPELWALVPDRRDRSTTSTGSAIRRSPDRRRHPAGSDHHGLASARLGRLSRPVRRPAGDRDCLDLRGRPTFGTSASSSTLDSRSPPATSAASRCGSTPRRSAERQRRTWPCDGSSASRRCSGPTRGPTSSWRGGLRWWVQHGVPADDPPHPRQGRRPVRRLPRGRPPVVLRPAREPSAARAVARRGASPTSAPAT